MNFPSSDPSRHSSLTARVLGDARTAVRCERTMEVPENLECLAGHFPGLPVVPGVVQIGWVMDVVREVLGRPTVVRRIEALKFNDLLRPSYVFHLGVEFLPGGQAVQFRLWGDGRIFSSGRLLF